ncbi:MAG: hypothetical protein IPK35_08790 [Saprospiraceae bacterium]|jgi:hypothetical protein|nr:hypothetical protein [Saprospiraceae bacterium]
MRYNNIICTLGAVIFFIFIGCAIEDNSGVKIEFTKVVGQYSGSSATCEIISPSRDSICTPSFTNQMKVILYDLNTIVIADDKKLFPQQRLAYKDTETNSNKRFHKFISTDSTDVTLTFDEIMNKIKIVGHDSILGKKNSKSFSGVKD